MPVVQYATFAQPRQFEGFPADESFKRSCEGALHFRPGATATLTPDELAHIQKEAPDLARHLLVIKRDDAPETKVVDLAQESKPAEPPPPETSPAPALDAVNASEASKKPAKKPSEK